MKPATPLPWKYFWFENNKRLHLGQHAFSSTEGPVYLRGGANGRCKADAEYIAHACNVYPKLVDALRETANMLRGAAYDDRQGISRRSGNPVEVYSERADEWERQANAADALLSEIGEAS